MVVEVGCPTLTAGRVALGTLYSNVGFKTTLASTCTEWARPSLALPVKVNGYCPTGMVSSTTTLNGKPPPPGSGVACPYCEKSQVIPAASPEYVNVLRL